MALSFNAFTNDASLKMHDTPDSSTMGEVVGHTEWDYGTYLESGLPHEPHQMSMEVDGVAPLQASSTYTMQTRAAQMCQDNLDSLLNSGKSKVQALAEDRILKNVVLHKAEYSLLCGPWNTYSPEETRIDLKATIKCAKYNFSVAPGPMDISAEFKVVSANLTADMPTTPVACPYELHIDADIDVSGQGAVSYRTNHNGALGPVAQKAFSGTDTPVIRKTLNIGQHSSGPGLETTPAPGGGGFGNMTLNAGADTHGRHKGWVQFEFVITPGINKSNMLHYDIQCVSGSASKLKVNSGQGPTPGVQPLQTTPVMSTSLDKGGIGKKPMLQSPGKGAGGTHQSPGTGLVSPADTQRSSNISCYICKKCGDNVGNDPNCIEACNKCSITAVQPSGGAGKASRKEIKLKTR